MVAFLNARHTFAHPLHDACAFVSQREGKGIVLDQFHAPRKDQKFQRIDRRSFYTDEHFGVRGFRPRDIPQACLDGFGVAVDLYRFYTGPLSEWMSMIHLHFFAKSDKINDVNV